MMLQPRRPTVSAFTSLLISVGLFLAASGAKAEYTVINDDLLPTVFTEVAAPAHYLVNFPKNGGALTDIGRNMLDAVLPLMRGASIRIVGRPDAIVYSRGKHALLASNRANSIRNYLTRQGIPYDSIIVEVDNTGNPQPNGSMYPAEIYVTKSGDRVARTSQVGGAASSYVIPAAYAATQRAAAAPMPQPPSSNGTRERLMQYINQAVMSGQMDAAVALKLMRTQMDAEPMGAVSGVPVVPAQWRADQQAAGQQPYQPAPVQVVQTSTWVLDKRLSLRENVDAWSRLAGWSPSAWEATGAFQITANSNVVGDFPGVLRQIADSTGLNICAKTREKIVRVTDANVSCK